MDLDTKLHLWWDKPLGDYQYSKPINQMNWMTIIQTLIGANGVIELFPITDRKPNVNR